ncbi:hypothetical protein ACHQM5_004206 [Ranunculus cassubicifolius]
MAESMDTDLYKIIINQDLVALNKVPLHLLLKAYDNSGGTALHVAVESNKVLSAIEIQRLSPVLRYCQNANGKTSLHLAAMYGHSEIVKALIYTSSVISKLEKSDTETLDLELCSKEKRQKTQDTESRELELEHRAKKVVQMKQDKQKIHPDRMLMRKVDKDKNTALHLAVEHENFEVVKLLTEADPGFRYRGNHNQMTPLDIAISNDSLRTMKQIVDACGFSASASNYHLHSAYDSWMKREDTDFLEVIHKRYPSCIYRQKGPVEISELHEATRKARIKIVQFLISAAAKIEFSKEEDVEPSEWQKIKDKVLLKLADKNKDTALHCAVKNKHLEVVKLLVEDKGLMVMVNGNNETALHLAVKKQLFGIVKVLVEADSDHELLMMVDKNKNTALHLAVETGYLEMVEYLTKEDCGNKLAAMGDENGNTAFHLAVRKHRLKVVNYFLSKEEFKTLVRKGNEDNETALHMAVRCNFLDIVKTLTQAGSDKEMMRMVDKNSNTALHLAVENNNIEIVQFFTDADEELVRMVNKNRNTVLHLAVLNQQLDTVKYFLSKVNQEKKLVMMINEDEDTALHLAVKKSHLKIVECLVGADPNKKWIRMLNKEKDSALHLAVQNSLPDIVKQLTLIDRQHIYSTNKAGKTPLYMAVEEGSYSMVKQILEACLSPSYNGPRRNTSLRLALDREYSEIRKLLLEKLPDQSKIVGEDGWTSLHYATSIPDLDAIEDILRSCPACSTVVNDNGQNFLHLAASLKMDSVVKHITESEYIVPEVLNIQDKYGYTPLHIAAETGEESLVLLLLYDKRVNKRTENLKGEKALDAIKFKYNKKKAGVEDVRDKVDEKELKDRSDFDLVVCALIATVSFTAGITVPGGYINDGPNNGKAVLYKEKLFEAFVMSNTFALMFSLCALFSHFFTKHLYSEKDINFHKSLATCCTLLAIFTMMVAFVTGSYAVLSLSERLAISVCGISSIFFIFAFYAISRMAFYAIRSMIRHCKEQIREGSSQHREVISHRLEAIQTQP